MRKFKILAAAGMLLASIATVTAVSTLKEPVQRYFTGKDVAAPLSVHAAELEGLSEDAAASLDVPAAWYIVDGTATDHGYAVQIQAQGVYLYGGRFALRFDTSKLKLDGPDSLAAFKLASGISSVAEVRPESQMVSGEDGYACLAWYCNGVDATEAPQTVATLNFQFQDGFDAKDIDASSFRLMAVEEGDMGPFRSSASLEGQGTLSTIPYEYLTTAQVCGVSFAYEGSDKLPLDGHKVTFTCRNNLDEPVAGVLTINGQNYEVDENGQVTVMLGGDTYLWSVKSVGYGDQTGKLELTEDTDIALDFVNDSSLVRAAAAGLSIGYQDGDSKDHVTAFLELPTYLDGSGVDVAWDSSNPSVINGGLVSLPQESGVTVTLTATLTRGEATAEKTFEVYVCSQAEVTPKVDETEETPETEPEAKPEAKPETKPETAPAVTVKFADLAQYGWAEDAIYHLAAEGVIKGTSETTFTPGSNIRRGDYILILTRLFDLESDSSAKDFDDVAEDSYYYEAIQMARALGIAKGDNNNCFNPEAPITREDMIVMTMRAVELTGYLSMQDAEVNLEKFLDGNDVSDYAQASMKAAVGEGLIIGDQNLLDPQGSTTRAQAAVFVERILNAHNG